MSPEPPASVFASYSRKDALLVKQLVGLFAAIDVPVFRDEQSIKPGRKWRVEIDAALEQCQVILVFWCEHAAASSEVRNEYERAIALSKRVVPVLLDQTALPPNLGEYQWVDLRMRLSAGHEFDRTLHADPGTYYWELPAVRAVIVSASRQLEVTLNSILDQ